MTHLNSAHFQTHKHKPRHTLLYQQFQDPCWVDAVYDAYRHLSQAVAESALQQGRPLGAAKLQMHSVRGGLDRWREGEEGVEMRVKEKKEEECVWMVRLTIQPAQLLSGLKQWEYDI